MTTTTKVTSTSNRLSHETVRPLQSMNDSIATSVLLSMAGSDPEIQITVTMPDTICQDILKRIRILGVYQFTVSREVLVI